MGKSIDEYTIEDINELVKKTDSEIIKTIGMAYLPLIVFVFEKKYPGQVKFIDIGGDCMIRYASTNIANMSYLATHLHFLNFQDDVLTLEGNVSIPAAYKDVCSFHILVNDREVEYKSFDAGLDKSIAGEKYECRMAFKVVCKLNNDSDYEIRFKLTTERIDSYCNKINSMRFMPIADVVDHQYMSSNGYILTISDGILKVKRSTIKDEIIQEDLFREQIRKRLNDEADTIIRIRQEFFSKKNKKKKIWLFFDRVDKANDNGEVLFRYVNEMHLEDVDSYFVIDKNSPDYTRLSTYGKVVAALTDEHKVLLLLADYIFTSQLNGFVENPFGEKCEYFRDLYHGAKVVFLQHGVTKDNQSNWLHRYKQNIHAVVVSSLLEKDEFLREDYGLTEEQVWLTGMPRYDELYHNEQRQILVMPTWRKALMHLNKSSEQGLSIWEANNNFENSKYVIAYKKFLNSKLLKLLCHCFKYKVAFVLHPLCQPYEECFQVPRWINRYSYSAKYNDMFAESDLMITDYSSVAFDFAYLNKPIIYFQFDEKDFYLNHTYKKGYFDYFKDGFGEVTSREVELFLALFRMLICSCKMKQQYKKRVEKFFAPNISGSCCKAIINKVEGNDIK